LVKKVSSSEVLRSLLSSANPKEKKSRDKSRK